MNKMLNKLNHIQGIALTAFIGLLISIIAFVGFIFLFGKNFV